MSSMRNAVTRRPHRERAQPSSRSKWGLLEKHKDYTLRAQDYNTKQKKLAVLKTKVRDRHPDEFAYGMVKNKQGKHGKGGDENRLSHDAVKLLKSQDAGYLRTALARGRKQMGKVQEELGVAGSERQANNEKKTKKIVFDADDNSSEARGKKRTADGEVRKTNAVEPNELVVVYPELPDIDDQDVVDVEVEVEDMALNPHAANNSSKPTTKKELERRKDASARLQAERKRRKRLQEVRTVRLEMLKKRQREIMAAADQLDLQRAKMAKTIGGVNKNGVKFKVRERKR